ncbi:hypothetical protein H5410_020724 [Solanum commersonii]|uniref:Uncharacterized protein n=1 Tax=Solanum commersonii TaxID=4109 RepID=A0A9J5Z8V4_SOLCO|nr:hypothetical protein H5410_020724 [Solanum commersonii]
MRSVIAASKAHTKRTRKRRRKELEPDQPASTPLIIENSETEFEDVAKYVAKKRRGAEEKMVKSKGNQKGRKKSPIKGVKSHTMSVKRKNRNLLQKEKRKESSQRNNP